MKMLYAIQGTGNGHITRAKDIVPLLAARGQLDVLISGIHSEIELGYPVKYRLHGLGFVFGKKGGIDLLETYRKSNLKQFWTEIKALPVQDYDVVISDFEPVSAWACHLAQKPCIGLSHQAAVINRKSPKPAVQDLVGSTVLKHYAPVSIQYGFHFNTYDKNIFTPVIRQQVRSLPSLAGKHYTVYLPAYSDRKILKVLSLLREEQWMVFSKHNKRPFTEGNVSFYPLSNEAFLASMAGSKGVLCGAGFETPAEALYLKKKLLVIPMKGQYEQQCNAAALQEMGIPVIKSLKRKHLGKMEQWLQSDQRLTVHYADATATIIDQVLQEYPLLAAKPSSKPGQALENAKGLRNYILKKLFARLSV